MDDAEDTRDGLLTFLAAYLDNGWNLDSATKVEKLLFAPLDEMTAHLADVDVVARVVAAWRLEIEK
jgi:hypothetical protein